MIDPKTLRQITAGRIKNLTKADLIDAVLTWADLREADLTEADLTWADLTGARLNDVDLRRARLIGANLTGANLTGANLTWADLTRADLNGADLTRADLNGADLTWARLTGAIMPDGRSWEDYRADHMAGLCDDPEVRARAIAAWGNHSWTDCPMHAAHGVTKPTSKEMAVWVALYDSGLLPKPE